jgi:hypothetical protein
MESEEWLEAEPMMKAQSDKIPDGLTTPELLERQRDPFSSFPSTDRAVHPTRVLASELPELCRQRCGGGRLFLKLDG